MCGTGAETVDVAETTGSSSATTGRGGAKDQLTGVRQKFDVQREDDEIVGPLQTTPDSNNPAATVSNFIIIIIIYTKSKRSELMAEVK